MRESGHRIYVAEMGSHRGTMMNAITYLFLIKTCFFLFLGVVIIMFALDYNIVAAILLVIGLVLMWKLYRCPECKCHLDYRVPLRDQDYCPSCGCNLTLHEM